MSKPANLPASLTTLSANTDRSSTVLHICSDAPPPFAAAVLLLTRLFTRLRPHCVPRMPPPLPAEAKLPSTVDTRGYGSSKSHTQVVTQVVTHLS